MQFAGLGEPREGGNETGYHNRVKNESRRNLSSDATRSVAQTPKPTSPAT